MAGFQKVPLEAGTYMMGAGSADAITSETASSPATGQLTDENDLANRVAQLEALLRTAKPSGARDQRSSQFLAQFYTAEYSAIMTRISAWASLQYAFFPILVAACAMLTKLDNVRANLRWWAATGVLLVGYLAYQGTMLDTLQKVLFIERYLRPLASRLVSTDRFWIHECIYRETQVANIFYWKYWPPIICLSAVIVVTVYIKFRHGLGGWDYTFFVGALLLSAGVLALTVDGARLEERIIKVCKERFPQPGLALLQEGQPNPESFASWPLSSRGVGQGTCIDL